MAEETGSMGQFCATTSFFDSTDDNGYPRIVRYEEVHCGGRVLD